MLKPSKRFRFGRDAVLSLNDLPHSPPLDDLQALLAPVQHLSDQDLVNLPSEDSPDVLSNEELLSFRPDGTPAWWPLSRDENGNDWSLSQRRRVLLRRLRENLPEDFPQTPSQPSDVHKLVRSLRHIAYGLTSQASGILSSS